MIELTKDTYHLLVPGEHYKLEVYDDTAYSDGSTLSADLVVLIDTVSSPEKRDGMTLIQVHMTVMMTTNDKYWEMGNNSFAAVINVEELPSDHDMLKYGYLRYSFQKL
jgi:hypothetical protein